MKKLLFPACLLFSIPCVLAQPSPDQEAPPDIEVKEFRVEQAPAAGGTKPWLRLLVDFACRPSWADGIAFYYDVLLQKGEEFRVLSGTARYSNVKRGKQVAVLYLSPNAAERFGVPIAAQIGVGYNDEMSEVFKWEAPGQNPPDGWATQFKRFPDQLMPISLTPFVATEHGKYPDALVPR